MLNSYTCAIENSARAEAKAQPLEHAPDAEPVLIVKFLVVD
jgi:hypothetical protein